MMRSLTYLAIALLTALQGVVHASDVQGWATNAWPALDVPRARWVRHTNTMEAVRERLLAAKSVTYLSFDASIRDPQISTNNFTGRL